MTATQIGTRTADRAITRRQAVIEAGIAAGIAAALSLLVFGPVLRWIATGWSGGDMLSTYINAEVWQGFRYRVTDQFGYPLGMNLNYFPGIDITENTFAQIITAITGRPFLGINLLVLITFPLVAFLAYFLFRMTGLTGALAITGAVVFSLLPYHFGRALGHTYLSTLYSAVTGMAFVFLVGSGRFEQIIGKLRKPSTRPKTKWLILATFAVMIVITAWTGVYYVAFTLILGAAALIWRFAHKATLKNLAIDAIPFASIAILAIIGFLPSILTTRADAPLAQLSERLPYESVVFAGNLAVALLPIPQSSLPGLGPYNAAVTEAIAAGGWGESRAATNHGTWITALALLTIVIALIVRARRGTLKDASTAPDQRLVTLNFIVYLIAVTLAWFIPWGLNYLFAGTVTAQIRAWNRWTPILLLLFLLGAAAAIHRTRAATRPTIAIPIAAIVLALTAIDSVLPFRSAYANNIEDAAEITKAANQYREAVNAAIPDNCGILQLPAMVYPEGGTVRGVNDYDHFWTSITNPGKKWTYGAVKNTDAGIWSAQLAELPTDEQVANMRTADFCAIHLDTRAFISERLPDITGNLEARFGAPVATGFDDEWLLFDITDIEPASLERSEDFFHQPMVTADPETTQPRETDMEQAWWWMKAPRSVFTLTATRPESPVTRARGFVQAPECGTRPITVILAADGVEDRQTVIADPDAPVPFDLTLPGAGASVATVEVQAPGPDCQGPNFEWKRYAQVINLTGA